MPNLSQDLRCAFRSLRKTPAFTLVAILTIALGIGANTAIFSILDPLLLRDLPIPRPAELVQLNSAGTLGPADISEFTTYETYRDHASNFSGVLAFTRIAPYQFKTAQASITANGELVSPDYFSVLAIRPFVGHFFTSSRNSAPAIVLSDDFWQRSFSAAPGIVGTLVTFGDQSDATRTTGADARTYTIVGVAPPNFFGAEVGNAPDFYATIDQDALPSQDYWQTQGVTILARLAPGISIAQAQSSLDPLLEAAVKKSQIPQIELAEHFAHALVTPASRGLSLARDQFGTSARILMAVVALLLLIACANVANLLLARGVARRREFTVRMALGASRARIIRQILVESSLLSFSGALLGLFLGDWTSRLLVASLSTRQLPISLSTALNPRTLPFAFIAFLFTTTVSAVVPALASSRGNLSGNLKLHSSGAHRASAMPPLVRALIVSQVALSMTLLASAGLLLHSLVNLETFDAGFQRDGVVLVSLDGYSSSRTRDQIATFYTDLLSRISSIPGVRSAAFVGFAPISGKEIGVNVVIDGASNTPNVAVNTRFVGISPRYFETMGIPLLAGRDFTTNDIHPESASYQSTNVAIINRAMSRRYFGDASPIGKHFHFVEGNRPPLEIVGLVADSKYTNLRESPTDFFYIPGTHGDLVIRTNALPQSLAAPLNAALRSGDSSSRIAPVQTLHSAIDESLHFDRLIAALCSAFSTLALLLAVIGLFGSLASSVARRTSEIGIRAALGAQPRDIFRLVLAQGLRLATLGLALGVFLCIAAASVLGKILFHVHRADPLTYVAISLLLLASASAACYLPARRATHIDPLSALRDE